MTNRTQAIARTAMIILIGAMIASGVDVTLSGSSAAPFDIGLSKGAASFVSLYLS